MVRRQTRIVAAVLATGVMLTAGAAQAQRSCGGDFGAWLAAFERDAAAQGISQATLQRALRSVRHDASVIKRDRAQSVFSQNFLEFAGRMVNSYRLSTGAKKLRQHAASFSRAEGQFGVPGPVIAAFWGLETDYGANLGDFPTLTALATLSHDCRRPEKFRPELMAALALIDRGDLSVEEMRGAWAGEIGQTQFLPSYYLQYAVDYDGDGRRNLIRSEPDVIGSTASLLAHHGWRAGQPWLEEVRVPPEMPWENADLAIRLPRAEWARLGVRRANGSPLPADRAAAALLLPMGRNGPAFLAYPNFDVFLQWNQSLVYATTAAYFATRLAGAPAVSRGNGPVSSLSFNEIKLLQRLLASRGYDVGGIDGFLGARTRAAVKEVQLRLGLPADSYPTPELLARLRSM